MFSGNVKHCRVSPAEPGVYPLLLGPENAEQFLKKLDAKKLLDLCADILFIEGHKNIRITDGTGDRQRDLRSTTPKGENLMNFNPKTRKDVAVMSNFNGYV